MEVLEDPARAGLKEGHAVSEPEYIRYQQDVIERRESSYQSIVIAHDPSVGHLLYLDDDLQIADADEPYNRALVDPLEAAGTLDRVLILGGGDGGVLKRALRAGARRAVLVDIDSEVIELSRRYLPSLCEDAFDHSRAEVVVGDAFAYLERDERWSGIVYDLTMEPVGAEESRTAFIRRILNRIADRLEPGGQMTMQVCGEDEPELRAAIRKGLDQAFEHWEDWPARIPSYDVQWIFARAHTPRANRHDEVPS